MDVLRRWRRWIRPACFTLYFIGLIVALPLCTIELEREGAPGYVEAWFIGGLFVMMAVPISLWGILQHLVYYTQPDLQRHIIRVLWMVPIYALNAWFALRLPSVAIYLDTLRECYEAYVIYNFLRYLLNFLYQEHPALEELLQQRRRVKHFVPFCCLSPWPRGRVFLNRCQHGVLQYTVVRPAMTALALICELAGKYDEGDFNFQSGWSYIVIINSVSQVWAMYCLVLFYKGTKEELAPISPVPKFLCIKAVVFLSFWQSTVIAALVKLDVIHASGTWVFSSVKEVATGLQDFLVCLEMFLAAIALDYSFPYQPFAEGVTERGNCCTSCLSMWDVSDIRDDVIDHARYIGRGVQKQLGRGRPIGPESTEMTPLLNVTTSTTMTTMTTTSNNPSAPSQQQQQQITHLSSSHEEPKPPAPRPDSANATTWDQPSETTTPLPSTTNYPTEVFQPNRDVNVNDEVADGNIVSSLNTNQDNHSSGANVNPVKLNEDSDFKASVNPVKLNEDSDFKASVNPVKLNEDSDFKASVNPVKLNEDSDFKANVNSGKINEDNDCGGDVNSAHEEEASEKDACGAETETGFSSDGGSDDQKLTKSEEH
ncbi:transmembrane protein 184C-like [Babylonia areolata]|uniref:transmembrane protein 184C-like n=1 Tax=Babylonia areolata TaxID=304850 RepID=UPI003FD2B849